MKLTDENVDRRRGGNGDGDDGVGLGVLSEPSRDGNGKHRLELPDIITKAKPVVFASPQMRKILDDINRLKGSDIPVLLTGETGTGKEVIAKEVHNSSKRSKGPMVCINCSALPRDLIESLLFGSAKGSFTGADRDRNGFFHEANGGTLFLDEITELDIGMQSKLLRVLQDSEVRRVGAAASYRVDCRIISSTNRKVEEAVRDGKLRADLMYRLAAFTIEIPPLRERTADIDSLAEQFLAYYAALENHGVGGFTQEALAAVRSYGWPGNVRQLENAIRRAVLMAEQKVDIHHLSLPAEKTLAHSTVSTLDGPCELDRVERETIVQTLIKARGNKQLAATSLGCGRQTIYNLIRKHFITPDEY